MKKQIFIDGNKRIGIYVMLVFLFVNGYEFEFSDDEIIDIALGTASGKYGYEDIFKILLEKSDE